MLRIKKQRNRLPVRDSPSVAVLKEKEVSGKSGVFRMSHQTLFFFDSMMQ